MILKQADNWGYVCVCVCALCVLCVCVCALCIFLL